MNQNDRRATDAPPDADNNLGRGAPYDREERVQQKRRNEARSIEQDPQYRQRQPHDLDREDGAIQREGAAEEKPGVRLSREERGEQARRAKNKSQRGE